MLYPIELGVRKSLYNNGLLRASPHALLRHFTPSCLNLQGAHEVLNAGLGLPLCSMRHIDSRIHSSA